MAPSATFSAQPDAAALLAQATAPDEVRERFVGYPERFGV